MLVWSVSNIISQVLWMIKYPRFKRGWGKSVLYYCTCLNHTNFHKTSDLCLDCFKVQEKKKKTSFSSTWEGGWLYKCLLFCLNAPVFILASVIFYHPWELQVCFLLHVYFFFFNYPINVEDLQSYTLVFFFYTLLMV